MPVASPTPNTISASASTAVLRKLRLNSRSAISLFGMPNRCRINAPTPTPPHAPPGSTSPPAELCPGDIVVGSPPAAVTIEHSLRVDDRAPDEDKPELGEHLERDRPEHPLPGHVLQAAQCLLQRGNQLQHHVCDRPDTRPASELTSADDASRCSAHAARDAPARSGPASADAEASTITSRAWVRRRSRCSGRAARAPTQTRRSPRRPCRARRAGRRTRAAPPAPPFR